MTDRIEHSRTSVAGTLILVYRLRKIRVFQELTNFSAPWTHYRLAMNTARRVD